jgi:hypothetical protein
MGYLATRPIHPSERPERPIEVICHLIVENFFPDLNKSAFFVELQVNKKI